MPGRHQFTPHSKLYLNAVAFFWFPQKTNLRSRECIQVKDVLYKTPRERKQERLKRGKWKGKKQKRQATVTAALAHVHGSEEDGITMLVPPPIMLP